MQTYQPTCNLHQRKRKHTCQHATSANVHAKRSLNLHSKPTDSSSSAALKLGCNLCAYLCSPPLKATQKLLVCHSATPKLRQRHPKLRIHVYSLLCAYFLLQVWLTLWLFWALNSVCGILCCHLSAAKQRARMESFATKSLP